MDTKVVVVLGVAQRSQLESPPLLASSLDEQELLPYPELCLIACSSPDYTAATRLGPSVARRGELLVPREVPPISSL